MVHIDDLTPGTIALTIGGKIAIVTQLKPQNTKYPVIYKHKIGANGYKGNEHSFIAILGKVDIDTFRDNDNTEPRPRTGYDHDFMVPDQLKGIKIGDTITIRSRRGTQEAVYQGYNPKAPKNCVNITIDGKDFKGPLAIVVGKAS